MKSFCVLGLGKFGTTLAETLAKNGKQVLVIDPEADKITSFMYEELRALKRAAAALKLTEGTTRNYVSSIYEKTHSENRADAIRAIKEVL